MAYFKYFTFIIALNVMILDGITCSRQVLNSATDRKRFLIFGDSPFDAGNMQYLPNDTDYIASMHFPYGFTYFTNATGRFCDGRILPDFLSEFANLGLIPPSLDPEANFSHGANFAAGDACVLDTSGSLETLNLGDQMNNFTYMVTNMKEAIGDSETEKVLMEAVYLFSIGGVDYANFYDDYYDNGTVPTLIEQEAFVKIIVGNISTRLLEIYNQGGRKFAFQSIGPIGCLPTAKLVYSIPLDQCDELQNELAKMHNKLLEETLNNMAQTLVGFKYSFFDYYNSLLDRIENPSKYGLTNAVAGCCGYIDDPYRGGGCAKVNFTICPYPSAYLFFDGSHPAQYTNSQIAKLMWSGTKNVTRPYNLMQFFNEDSVEIY